MSEREIQRLLLQLLSLSSHTMTYKADTPASRGGEERERTSGDGIGRAGI